MSFGFPVLQNEISWFIFPVMCSDFYISDTYIVTYKFRNLSDFIHSKFVMSTDVSVLQLRHSF